MTDNLNDNALERLIIRYLNNQMSKEERLEFEQALERDPFLSEAVDGLAAFKPSDVAKDLASLGFQKRSKNKTKTTYVALVFVIIALLALLILWYQGRKKTDKLSEDAPLSNEDVTFTDTLVFTSNTDSVVSFIDSLMPDSLALEGQEEITNNPVTETSKVKSEKKQDAIESSQPKSVEKRISPQKEEIQPELSDSNELLSLSLIPVPSIEANKILTTNSGPSAGQQLSLIEDQFNAESINDRGPYLHESAAVVETVADSNPVPQGGMNDLIQYVEKNINYPQIENPNETVSLKVGFTVSESGRLYDFKQERGPENKLFFNEVVRVLREGPTWAPAVKDGKVIEEQVSLSIVFRP